MPVQVRVASDVSVHFDHVSREINFLLIIDVKEGLPVVVGDQLQGQNSLDARSNVDCLPRVIELTEQKVIPQKVQE